MSKCWICMDEIKDYLLLPYSDEYLEGCISLFKDTFIIKDIDNFKFAYYTCCNYCINQYLKIYNYKFKYLIYREIGKKI